MRLEENKYLEAAEIFLLARHVYSQLCVSMGVASGLTAGPVSTAGIQKMWQSVAGFKDIILEASDYH